MRQSYGFSGVTEMESVNYAELLPTEPPEGLVPWLKKKRLLDQEYLIYQSDWAYDPLEERNRRVVRLTCTACGAQSFAERVGAPDCSRGYTTAPFGFVHPESLETLGSGDCCLCPVCGAEAKAKHISSVREDWSCQEVYPMTVTRVGDKLALLGWCARKWFEKDGTSGITVWPYEAYVVEQKKIVRLNGYTKFMSKVTLSGHWEQRKKYSDRWGRADLIYPWDRRILEGTTAENSKLNRYLRESRSEPPQPVTYLRLWLAHPQIENLVMQGASNLLSEWIRWERTGYGGGPAVLDLNGINWSERSPARMLGMNRAEFRACIANKWSRGDVRFWQMQAAEGRRLTSEEMELAKSIGFHNCERLEQEEGLDWRKVAHYLNRQKKKDARSDMFLLWDTWNMAKRVGEDPEVPEVRFPPNLLRAHDRYAEELARRKEAEEQRKMALRAERFALRYAELSPLAWERDGILIRPVKDEPELRAEGMKQKHCVATYARKHADGESAIFLIRHADAPEEPWYTLELDAKRLEVLQNRGKCNCDRTTAVQKFETEWLAHIRALRSQSRKKKGRKEKEAEVA